MGTHLTFSVEWDGAPHLTFPGGGGTLPCDLSRDGFAVTYLPPPPGQTDACENITFLQLRLRAVNNRIISQTEDDGPLIKDAISHYL